MSRPLIAWAVVVACFSFLKTAHATTDDNGTYWATAPDQEGPPPTHHARIEYTPTHAPPFEPPAARFGARGQVVMTGGTSIGLSYTSYSDSDASAFGASFAPAIGFGPNFSHDLSRSDHYGRSNRATTVGAGAELGVWL